MRAIESANARLAADSVRGAEIKAMLKRHAEATAAHVRAAEAVAAAKDAAVRERQTQVRARETRCRTNGKFSLFVCVGLVFRFSI